MNIILFIRTYTLHNRLINHTFLTMILRRYPDVFLIQSFVSVSRYKKKREKERGKRERLWEKRGMRGRGMHLC